MTRTRKETVNAFLETLYSDSEVDFSPQDTLRVKQTEATTTIGAQLPSLRFQEESQGNWESQKKEPADLVLQETLGEGGMGVVHLALQPQLGRQVAVKRLHEETTEAAVQNLIHEARTMGGLEHPNVVPVHALGQDEDGRPVLVMKRWLCGNRTKRRGKASWKCCGGWWSMR